MKQDRVYPSSQQEVQIKADSFKTGDRYPTHPEKSPNNQSNNKKTNPKPNQQKPEKIQGYYFIFKAMQIAVSIVSAFIIW